MLLRIIACLTFAPHALAEIVLPPVFSEHAVLQAGQPLPIWGESAPGEAIEVSLAGQTRHVIAGEDGHWRVDFAPFEKSRQPVDLIVAGEATHVIRGVIFGDVWLAAGQSNMMTAIRRTGELAIAARELLPADVRFFNGGRWEIVCRERLPSLPAVPWAFAREWAETNDVAVGMIAVARGGTRIESWLPLSALQRTEAGAEFARLARDPEVIAAAAEDAQKFKPYAQTKLSRWRMGRALPMALYDALIHPLNEFALSGVLWYQGENNAQSMEEALAYREQLVHLVESWRGQWKRPNLPFFIVGLPEYHPKEGEGSLESWAALRASQQEASRHLAHAFWVDAFDLGDVNDIHPKRKYELGRRLAQHAQTVIKADERR